MQRATILERLDETERDVTLGAEHIRRQRELVAEMEREGHDATQAREFLARFEELQALHVQERD